MIWLTKDEQIRSELVVSPAGDKLAYVIRVPTLNENMEMVRDVEGKNFRQIFVLEPDMGQLEKLLVNL